MGTLTPELLTALTLTGGLAVAMVWLARQKSMLEDRLSHRRCPSCGRLARRDGSCGCYR
jgi:hypothetical protein